MLHAPAVVLMARQALPRSGLRWCSRPGWHCGSLGLVLILTNSFAFPCALWLLLGLIDAVNLVRAFKVAC